MYDPAYTGRVGRVDRVAPMPHKQAPSFGPEIVRIMGAAFDAASASVEASGAFADSESAEIAQKILAGAILQAARQGERDESKLRDIALLELARKGRKISTMRGRTTTTREQHARSSFGEPGAC
jgi:hypothetical protein